MKRLDVLTLVPDAFTWFLAQHPVKDAVAAGAVDIRVHNFREYSPLSHHTVDDTPYGGGPGMVTRVDVVAAALTGVFRAPPDRVKDDREVLVLSAGGRPFDQASCDKVASSGRDLVLLCGRFEGFDARVEDLFASGSISIGPYVLAGGELAAMVVIEALVRRLPGSLGNLDSVVEESFSEGLEGRVEYPHYTRPREFMGRKVPDVLLSGDHAAVARWRRAHTCPSAWRL